MAIPQAGKRAVNPQLIGDDSRANRSVFADEAIQSSAFGVRNVLSADFTVLVPDADNNCFTLAPPPGLVFLSTWRFFSLPPT